MKKRLLLLTLMMMLFPLVCAQAQIVSLDSYSVEELPFACDLRFVSGVRVQGETNADFVLVDTIDFNGHYFEMLRGTDARCHGSISGIRIEPGWTATVDAADIDHCSLTVDTGAETRTYHFRFVPQLGEGDWEMERYTIQSANSFFEARVAGLWRMEIIQTLNGHTEQDRAAFYWANDCYNLVLEELPRSIEGARRMEQEAPVAAIAPEDAGDRVNLREGPSTDDPRVGSLYSGVMVRIHGDVSGEWLYVNPLEGATLKAYVRRDLLAFGEEIWHVPNAAQNMLLSSGSNTVPFSYYPYHANTDAGWFQSGVTASIIGYYNDDWAIVGTWPGALYIETKYLHQP